MNSSVPSAPTQAASAKDPVFASAFDVCQHLLEVTRTAYMNRDADAFAARFITPQRIGTFDGDQVITTRQDVLAIFDEICGYLDRERVIDMNRRTIEAEFVAPDVVQATFVSQYVLPGYVLSNEVLTHSTQKLQDGIWRVADSYYATNIPALTRALTSAAERKRNKSLA
ncbi:hypothetical protein [Primorskyibacter sp. S187A]|uniref:hypothetical protein n=1 Tax=Primorskyibacter sp. S187A TaxID=3415130 RepID=UPI003C7EAF35